MVLPITLIPGGASSALALVPQATTRAAASTIGLIMATTVPGGLLDRQFNQRPGGGEAGESMECENQTDRIGEVERDGGGGHETSPQASC